MNIQIYNNVQSIFNGKLWLVDTSFINLYDTDPVLT